MSDLLLQFVLAMFATCGFCIIFNVPAKSLPPCIIIGAIGYSTYVVSDFFGASPVLACFAASCMVGLLSDIASRIFKEASTIFIIPGILCLVPGSKIYKTMEAMLLHDMDNTASIGTQTLLMAGAIAIGLLVIGSVINLIRAIAKKTVKKVNDGLFK